MAIKKKFKHVPLKKFINSGKWKLETALLEMYQNNTAIRVYYLTFKKYSFSYKNVPLL